MNFSLFYIKREESQLAWGLNHLRLWSLFVKTDGSVMFGATFNLVITLKVDSL